MLRSQSLSSVFHDTTEIETASSATPLAPHSSNRDKVANMTTTRVNTTTDATRAESLEPGEIVEVLTVPRDLNLARSSKY
jgi:hypothetical protein